MAAPKLTEEQRNQLREWLAADYDTRLILAWFKERDWPEISRVTIHGYRQRDAIDIERIRSERRSAALTTGLAVKEERIARLKLHADRLEELKWQPDEKGRLWNEKAWREVVQQIADEMEPKKVEMLGKVDGPPVLTLNIVNGTATVAKTGDGTPNSSD